MTTADMMEPFLKTVNKNDINNHLVGSGPNSSSDKNTDFNERRRPSALEIETIQEVTEKLYSQFVQQVAKTLHKDEKVAWSQAIQKEVKTVVGEEGIALKQCKKNKPKDSWIDEESLSLRPLELLNVKTLEDNTSNEKKKSSFIRGKSGKSLKGSVRFKKETQRESESRKVKSASHPTQNGDEGRSSHVFQHFSRDRFLSLRRPKSEQDSENDIERNKAALLFSKLNLSHIVIPKVKPQTYQEHNTMANREITELKHLKPITNNEDSSHTNPGVRRSSGNILYP